MKSLDGDRGRRASNDNKCPLHTHSHSKQKRNNCIKAVSASRSRDKAPSVYMISGTHTCRSCVCMCVCMWPLRNPHALIWKLKIRTDYSIFNFVSPWMVRRNAIAFIDHTTSVFCNYRNRNKNKNPNRLNKAHTRAAREFLAWKRSTDQSIVTVEIKLT